jgi:hypothetical protein
MFSFVCQTKGGFQVGLYLVMVALAKQHPPETFSHSLPDGFLAILQNSSSSTDFLHNVLRSKSWNIVFKSRGQMLRIC